jgi:hypothetical protein
VLNQGCSMALLQPPYIPLQHWAKEQLVGFGTFINPTLDCLTAEYPTNPTLAHCYGAISLHGSAELSSPLAHRASYNKYISYEERRKTSKSALSRAAHKHIPLAKNLH